MLTSSSTTLTLELSRLPWTVVPRPVRPGVPVCGVPLETVSLKRFSPMGCSPSGLTKSASWMLPICCGALLPATSAVTVPSDPMVTLWVLAGTVMVGCSWYPDEVTIWPFWSSSKDPSRL